MSFKKCLISLVVSGFLFNSSVFASGIPVVDAASIAQMVKDAATEAQHAKEQMDAYANIISQAKSQFEETKDMISGNWKLGDFVDQQLMNGLIPDDWEEIYNDMDSLVSLREKFGLKSDNADVQKQYDKLLSGYNVLDQAEEVNNTRVENLKQLGKLLDSAETPQQKEDLKLRIQLEQANIQNEQIRLQNVKDMMDKQEKLDNVAKEKGFMDDMRGGL
ncbi:conjugal transfer protein [Salmonella enterica]|uniref:type IV secretion system protein n=1 Tax=Salmonella enterica TaxID=28901 RepID=UPI003315F9AC|nr:conjugal transfer protein [Salmonella enterica]